MIFRRWEIQALRSGDAELMYRRRYWRRTTAVRDHRRLTAVGTTLGAFWKLTAPLQFELVDRRHPPNV